MDMPLRFRRLLYLCLLGVSAAAGAQTLTLSFSSGAEQDWVVGSAACANTFDIHWRYVSGTRMACSSGLKVWASPHSCADTDSRVDLFSIASNSAEFLTGYRNMALSSLPGFGGEPQCGELGIQRRHYICAEVALADSMGNCNNNPEKLSADPISVVYKTTPPPAPVMKGAEGYDGRATIHFSAPGDYLKEVLLLLSTEEGDNPLKGKQEEPSRGSVSVSGLEDGVLYTFFLRTVDKAGNTSPPSAPIEVTTVRTDGFWDIYKAKGGENGGCHSAGQGSLAALALALLGFGIVRRSC